MAGEIPPAVHRRLKRGQPYELDWGAVLRPPTDPSSAGAAGAYRWDYYEPPVQVDGTHGVRRGSSARDLAAAWLRASAKAAELEARMCTQEAGHRLDITFGELAKHYLDPARHPERNDANHADNVRLVTTKWLLGDGITVADPHPGGGGRQGGAAVVRLRDVPLRQLTGSMMVEGVESRARGPRPRHLPDGARVCDRDPDVR